MLERCIKATFIIVDRGFDFEIKSEDTHYQMRHIDLLSPVDSFSTRLVSGAKETFRLVDFARTRFV